MTPDQKTPLAKLEDAVFSARHKGRIENIRKTYLAYRTTILIKPWYKRGIVAFGIGCRNAPELRLPIGIKYVAIPSAEKAALIINSDCKLNIIGDKQDHVQDKNGYVVVQLDNPYELLIY